MLYYSDTNKNNMKTTTNTVLKYIIIAGLAIIPFISLYVANGNFFPFITGKAFAFRIIVEIVFATWLVLLLREKGTSVVGTEKSVAPSVNMMTIFVTGFAVLVLVADLAGLNPIRSIWSNFERMEGWMTIIHLWAYFIILSSVLNTKENWNKFFNVVLVAGTIVGFYGLFQFFGWVDIHQGSTRVDASLGNSAYMAVYMLINAFLAGYMAFSAKIVSKKPLVWIYSILGAFFSFIMFQTATRGTILGWIAGILLACAIYAIFGREEKGQSNKSRLISGGIITLVIIVGILFYFNRNAGWIQNNGVLGRIASISISDTKTQARGFIWPMALKGVFESPKRAIIGVGQENFNYIFNANYDPKMYTHEQWFDRAHSVFIDWLVAGGILGLLAYLALYVLSFIYIVKSDLNIGQKSMLIALLVSYGIHNIFVFDNQTSYVMFFTFLAFVHTFKSGKTYRWLGGVTEGKIQKPITENYTTVMNYIFVPVIAIAFVVGLYFINIRPIQANTRLIDAMSACNDVKNISTKSFEDIFKLDQTVANQEVREQLFICAGNIIRNQQLSEKVKAEFYDLVKKEIDKQIATTPNDARIYIIAGGFFDSINDLQSATSLLEKAVELSPTKQTIIFELVANYLNIGKEKEALDLAEKAYNSAIENENAKIAYIVALIYNGEKKADELLAESPDLTTNPRVINAYVANKKYNKAIELYKVLLKKTPDDRNLYSAMASAYLMNNQKAQAIELLKIAVTKFPDLKTQIEGIIKQIQDGTLKL